MMTEEQRQARIESITFRLKTLDLLEEDGMHFDVVERERERDSCRIALAALTQPASPALKLPGTISVRTAIAALDNASAVTTIAQSYKMAWNSCIAETKSLNAPHTAPIEPICATGGAEWVKCSERMPEQLRDLRAGENVQVLVWSGEMSQEATYVAPHEDEDAGTFVDYFSYQNDYPTHWMFMPAAPKP